MSFMSLEPAPEDSRFHASNDPVFERVGICHTCAHRTSVRNCKAFPQGIPVLFLGGRENHTEPYPGDNGLIYKPLQQ